MPQPGWAFRLSSAGRRRSPGVVQVCCARESSSKGNGPHWGRCGRNMSWRPVDCPISPSAGCPRTGRRNGSTNVRNSWQKTSMTDIAIRIGALQHRPDTTSTNLSASLRDALTGFLHSCREFHEIRKNIRPIRLIRGEAAKRIRSTRGRLPLPPTTSGRCAWPAPSLYLRQQGPHRWHKSCSRRFPTPSSARPWKSTASSAQAFLRPAQDRSRSRLPSRVGA